MKPKPQCPPGFTIVELMVVLLVLGLLLGLTVPIIAGTSCDSLKNVSIANLQRLAQAHAMYAADWNDRQFTLARDDISQFGVNLRQSCAAYNASGDCHPPVILGEDCAGVTQGFYFGCGGDPGICDSFFVVAPINFVGPRRGWGSFRLPNARGFHEYVNGRFFDPTFYAPKDAAVYEEVEPFFDEPCEFVNVGIDLIFASSYALSPAAMYHPDVFRAESLGGFRNPFSFPDGFRSPTVSQAEYSAQKSRMIEHNWLQNPAAPCNPNFGGCVPYYFNHGYKSVPMTLFYDGHVAHLSTLEATQSNNRMLCQTGQGLWSRDTPFGGSYFSGSPGGYFMGDAYDTTTTSYHILTLNGIRGRDTLK